MNSLDGYRIKAESYLYEGNLLLVDECLQVYTCFYMERDNGERYISIKVEMFRYCRWRSTNILSCISRIRSYRNSYTTAIMETAYLHRHISSVSGFPCLMCVQRK